VSDIDVSVSPISGRVRFGVSVDAIPTLKTSMWKSFDKHLLIKSSDPKFSPNGTYYVFVYMDELNLSNTSSF